MTAFITHCWKNARLEWPALLLCVALGGGWPGAARAETPVAEVVQLQLARAGDGIVLAAAVQFDLPSAVQDALLKGVPVFFVAEAELFRERWYWMDRRVAGAARHMRLAFHPLTRRWRLGVAVGPMAGAGAASEAVLSRNFDSLEEAMAAVRRVSGWRIAELADVAPEAAYRLEFRFRLDVSQLPRPLQIGVLGQADWHIATSTSQKLLLENLK
jgi:hypothetical protein